MGSGRFVTRVEATGPRLVLSRQCRDRNALSRRRPRNGRPFSFLEKGNSRSRCFPESPMSWQRRVHARARESASDARCHTRPSRWSFTSDARLRLCRTLSGILTRRRLAWRQRSSTRLRERGLRRARPRRARPEDTRNIVFSSKRRGRGLESDRAQERGVDRAFAAADAQSTRAPRARAATRHRTRPSTFRPRSRVR